MIQMPHRSVTRYFIPLIDVLLLLFCIFLLMPIVNEEELQGRRDTAADLGDQVEVLERELDLRLADLQKYESLKPALAEVERLKEEVARLQMQLKQGIQKALIHPIFMDETKRMLYYFDRTEGRRIDLPDERAARLLIARHKQEAMDREMRYEFLFPQKASSWPTQKDVEQFQKWFENVANSLEILEKG